MSPRLRSLALSAWIAATIGCSRDRAVAAAPDASATLEVLFAGCAAVRSGPVCELPASRTIRVWAPGGKAPGVTFDGKGDGGVGAAASVQRGSLLTLQVPPDSGVILFEHTGTQPSRGQVRVGVSTEPAWAQRAQGLRRSGKLDEAEAEIAGASKTGAADEARAEGLLARIALVKGDVNKSIAHFETAIRRGAEAGLLSLQADDAMALSFALVQRSLSYTRAREVLDALPPLAASYPEGWAREPYYRGLIEGKSGNWRAALSLLRESNLRAGRLGMTQLVRNSDEAIANQLLFIGRTREALEIQRRLWAADTNATPACDRAVLANNMAFALLSSPEGSGRQERAEAIGLLGSALDFLERGCPDPYRKANALTDLTLALIQDGQLEKARASLQRARDGVGAPNPTMAAWWQEAEGRLALARKDGRAAQKAFEREQELAGAAGELRLQWWAAVGKGMALESQGRARDALDAYEHADAVLDLAAEMVPLGEGRALFVGDRTSGAQRRISLLIEQSRASEAFAVARQSRARLLRSLQLSKVVRSFAPDKARAWEEAVADYKRRREALSRESEKDWQLPADQLAERVASRAEAEQQLRASLERALSMISPAPDRQPSFWSAADNPDVLVVAFHPVPDGWAVFAAHGAELQAARVRSDATESASALASRLIEPIQARISSARRIRFMPYGRLLGVDFHGLVFQGSPLIRRATVEYSLDLALSPDAATARQSALVVANPTLDLVSAEGEGERVAEALKGGAEAGVRLLKGRAATVAELTRLLPTVSFFHYAGHGEPRGAEGWESSLPLAGDSALWVSDILALQGSPATVVLSACEGARGASEAPVETLSLAHAFVLAGSREVLAPTRPVTDRLAFETVDRLYAVFSKNSGMGLAEALQTVQAEQGIGHANDDWQAFRVLTP